MPSEAVEFGQILTQNVVLLPELSWRRRPIPSARSRTFRELNEKRE